MWPKSVANSKRSSFDLLWVFYEDFSKCFQQCVCFWSCFDEDRL